MAALGRALGMAVLISERKGVPPSQTRPTRTSFSETLGRSTVLLITLPLTPDTTSLISTAELSAMRGDSILINVSRGGIVDETALVDALRAKRIAGAATDVFVTEPAGRENVLVREAETEGVRGRLVLSPHVAWYARSSIEKLRATVAENVHSWARGEGTNIVVG